MYYNYVGLSSPRICSKATWHITSPFAMHAGLKEGGNQRIAKNLSHVRLGESRWSPVAAEPQFLAFLWPKTHPRLSPWTPAHTSAQCLKPANLCARCVTGSLFRGTEKRHSDSSSGPFLTRAKEPDDRVLNNLRRFSHRWTASRTRKFNDGVIINRCVLVIWLVFNEQKFRSFWLAFYQT